MLIVTNLVLLVALLGNPDEEGIINKVGIEKPVIRSEDLDWSFNKVVRSNYALFSLYYVYYIHPTKEECRSVSYLGILFVYFPLAEDMR